MFYFVTRLLFSIFAGKTHTLHIRAECLFFSKINLYILMSQSNKSLDVNETLVSTEAFLIKNKQKLIMALVAVAVVFGAFFGGRYYLNSQNEEGQAAIALGQTYVQQGDWKKAVEGDGAQFKGYKKLADTYSWTDAGNVAHMYAGIAYFNLGEYKKAIEELESFSAKGDATASANALAALGNAYIADKQLDNGVKNLKKAADKADNETLSPEYLIQAGLVLESQGKKSEANALYVRIKNDYPRSRYSQNSLQNGVATSPEIDKYIERTK